MPKPFGQLFATPNNYYYFDANTDQIIPISRESFEYLDLLTTNETPKMCEPFEVRSMRENQTLSYDSVVQKIEHPYSRYLGLLLERCLHSITLQVTQNCNFRCKYCIYSETSNINQRAHSAKNMTWEVAKQAVDFLWQHSLDSEKISVGFYGGEPLLQFPLIKRVVSYCKWRFSGKTMKFNLTTNATLLTDEIIHYLAQENIALLISIDGPRNINDKNRVFKNGEGTFDAVLDKINRLYELEHEYAQNVQFSMVMDPTNDFDCINSLCTDSNIIHDSNLLATIVDREYDFEETEFTERYSAKFKYQMFLAMLSYFHRVPQSAVSPIAYMSLVSDLDAVFRHSGPSHLYPADAPGGPCVPGHFRLFSDVDGNLFPCERVSETSRAMNIGSLSGGLNKEATRKILNVGAVTADKCSKCWAFRYCSLCAKWADDGTSKLSGTRKMAHCIAARNRAYTQLCEQILLQEVPQYYAPQIRIGRNEQDEGNAASPCGALSI